MVSFYFLQFPVYNFMNSFYYLGNSRLAECTIGVKCRAG